METPAQLDPIRALEERIEGLEKMAEAQGRTIARALEIDILEASLAVAEHAVKGDFLFRTISAAEAMNKLRRAHVAAGDLEDGHHDRDC